MKTIGHSYWRSNELAGEAAVMHAYQLKWRYALRYQSCAYRTWQYRTRSTTHFDWLRSRRESL